MSSTNKNYVRKLVDDYCVLDLETTGLSYEYDEIIEIGILKVRNNVIVDRYEQLVKPIYPIDEFITELTGITNSMVADKPGIEAVKNDVLKFIGSDLIVGHNTSFDINFLGYNFDQVLTNEYVDTIPFCRKLFTDLKHHRLKDMVKYLNLSKNEHRAISDCTTTKELYDSVKKRMADANLKIEDLFVLKKKYTTAKDIKCQSDIIDEDNFFFGKHCVFTGKLEKMLRKEAMQLIVNVGGILDDTVTKQTNYLILGNNDYCSSIKDGKSKKQKKAEAYKLKGQDIEVLPENMFYELIEQEF